MPFNVSGMGAADVVAVFGADTSGFDRGLSSMETAMGQTGGRLGGIARSIGQGMGMAIGQELIKLAQIALDVAVSFDNAFDRIAISTGETGAALAGLEQSFRNVVSEVPASFEEASQAISMLAQRTELTGPALEHMATQVLELSRLTGTDLTANIAATTRMFQDWSIASEQQAGSLDKLFVASQQTGIGITRLSELVVQFGAPLRSLGFTFDQSVAMMAKFEKEGVNITTVLAALRIGLSKFAAAGKEPAAAFAEVSKQIKEATSETEALSIGMEAFGKRGGADMTRAILENRLNLDELIQKLGESDGAIQRTADQTDDFSEKLTVLKNRVLLAAEPLAGKLFDAINNLMPVLEELGRNFETTFTNMGNTANAFFADYSAAADGINSSNQSMGTSITHAAELFNAGLDAILTGIRELLVIVRMAATIIGKALSGDWTGIISSWNEGTSALSKIDEAWRKRLETSAKTIDKIYADAGRRATSEFSNAFKNADPNSFLIQQMQANQAQLNEQARKTGFSLMSSLKAGSFAASHQSPFFLTHWFAESLHTIQGMVPQAKTIGDSIGRAFSDGVGRWLEPVSKSIAGMLKDSKEKFEQAMKDILEIGLQVDKLPPMFNKAADGVKEAMESVSKAAEEAREQQDRTLKETRDIYDDFFEGVLGGWGSMINDTLKMLNGMNDAIPSSIGGVIEKLAGVFGASVQQAQKWAQSITGIVGGVATFMGSRHQGKLAGVMGGIQAGVSIGSGIGMLVGGPIGAGIGAGIGAIGGAIAGLFGSGKSAAEKAEEERQKKMAAIQTEQAIANLTQGIMEGLEKGRQLLENLSNFVAVPKQALKKFFKQLEMLLVSFVEMSKQFSSEGLQKAKEVSENLESVFGFLIGAVQFSVAVRELEDVSDETIAKLMSVIARINTGFEKIIAELDTQTVKRSARLATKLTTVFSFISIIPETLKLIAEAPDVTDEILEKIFANTTKIIDKFDIMVGRTHDYAMSKLAKSSKQFADIFTAMTAILGALKSIGEYTPMSDAALDAVDADFQKVIDAIAGWTAMGEKALENALNLEDVVRRLRESLARSLGGLSSIVQGQASTAAAIRQQGTTTIDRRDQSVRIGDISMPGSDPRVAELYEFVRSRFGASGIGQIAQAH